MREKDNNRKGLFKLGKLSFVISEFRDLILPMVLRRYRHLTERLRVAVQLDFLAVHGLLCASSAIPAGGIFSAHGGWQSLINQLISDLLLVLLARLPSVVQSQEQPTTVLLGFNECVRT